MKNEHTNRHREGKHAVMCYLNDLEWTKWLAAKKNTGAKTTREAVVLFSNDNS